jgi:lipopolysaccharide transport protein LptA
MNSSNQDSKSSEQALSQGIDDKATAKDNETIIDSDHCVIHRDKQMAYFTMDPKKPLERQFVRITQPTLFAKGRRAELNYGSFSKIVQYLVAYEDVFIKELGKGPEIRYGTGGEADFDENQDLVVLKEYPQVYQDNNTVTGDVITLHRKTDIVEVKQSNAFSAGD